MQPGHIEPTMEAAVNQGDGSLRIERIPVPELGPTDALVEVSHCGICGTDLHMILDGWGRAGSTGGHEWSGVVVAVGENVDAWTVGDRVVGGPGPGCGECGPCRLGRPSLCLARAAAGTGGWQGAFARYTRSGQEALVAVPEDLSLREAALTEPLSVALHSVTIARPEPGDRVLVTGAGPIGLLIIAVLRSSGIDDVTASEPGSNRRERALSIGAMRAVTPEELTVPRLPMELVAHPYDVVFECSGRGPAQEAALAQLGRSGRLVLVGAGMDWPRFDANRIILNELLVTGSNEYWAGDFDRAISLLRDGALPVDALVEPADVPLSGMLEALRGLAGGELAGKVLVAPGQG